MDPLPVTILTGFLGAGKTTLLARLLAEPHDARIGVILNELGPAGIDRVDAAYLELTAGCVCCVQNPDLVAALDEMAARGDVDRVVLETTGVADPLPLTWTLSQPDLEDRARLDAVITVVDAANFERTQVAEWEAQVSCADLVVLSKGDLAGAEGLVRARRAIAERNPGARVVEVGAVPPSLLFDVAPGPREAPAAAPGARHSRFGAIAITGDHVYRAGALEDLLEALPAAVFRAKGIARTGDGWASFHVVGGRVQFEPDAPAPAHGESRIVLLGEALDRGALEALVARCRTAG